MENINEMLHLAKLTEDDIKPISQTIYFTSENLYNNEYRLMQLDTYLQKEIHEGNTLYIKGDDNEEVVICTENKTFHVTEAETSNSLLLVKGLKFSENIDDQEKRGFQKVEVKSIFYEYLEPVVGKPNLKKLNTLLKDSLYKGPEFEFEVNNEKLYTVEELEYNIQASNREIKEALDSMDVIKIDNKVRLLDFEYHFRVLSYMLKLIDENSWGLDHIDYDETLEALTDLVPRDVISTLFEKYTEESKVIDGIQLYRYKEEKVCKFFAEVLLHDAGRFNFNEFLQAWKESVPEGMVPDEKMLYGVAIIDKKSNPNVIWALDEKLLPEKITDRFNILFAAKEKWTVPEIAPYVQ